jgi:hypothetical protein
MKDCKKCICCTGCVWQFYSFGIVRTFALRAFVKAVLLKQHAINYLHELSLFYPERRKVVLHILTYKVVLWLSIDEVGDHAVL